jgi:hypothetical protein
MNTREQHLSAALLWLHNHYELGPRGPEHERLKADVIERVDRILSDGPPISGDIMFKFREKYPRRKTG